MTDPFARYWQAVTHLSYSEGHGGPSYERLEFLGDSVLQLAISEMLVERFGDLDPGELTRRRQHLVQNRALAEISEELQLPSIARLGRGEAKEGGANNEKLKADLVEALLGAIYLEEGWAVARAVVRARWRERVRSAKGREADPKTALQHLVQRRHGTVPEYRSLGSDGPDHARTFEVAVAVQGEVVGTGRGRSKKRAERAAAAQALRALEDHGPMPEPFGAPQVRFLAHALRRAEQTRGPVLHKNLHAEGFVAGFLAALAPDELGEERAHGVGEGRGRLPREPGNTTHISAVDADGCAVSLTHSLGETCGLMVPGTGVLLNNFLGESDVFPEDADLQPGQRLLTMCCPTLLEVGGATFAMGSGGSSRSAPRRWTAT